MTAKEMIWKAQEVDGNSTMLEIAQAKKDMRTIADIIAGGNLQVAYNIAMDKIAIAEEEQQAKAVSGQLVRIM